MDHHLEYLGDDRFQLLCQSLLVKEYPNVKCFPINQRDGGRDATRRADTASTFTVYQIKFTREGYDRDRREWLTKTIEGEKSKIRALVERGASQYILITNVPGTGHLDTGSIDSLEATLTAELGISVTTWWRDDINRRLDNAWDIKLRYSEVLTGHDMLHLLLLTINDDAAERRYTALKAFLRDQYEEDHDVKFKQANLNEGLLDLFIDIPCRVRWPRNRLALQELVDNQLIRGHVTLDAQSIHFASRDTLFMDPPSFDHFASDPDFHYFPLARSGYPGITVGTASVLLSDSIASLTRCVVEGAPGQGKSTLAQYICQVNRIRWLAETTDLKRLPDLDQTSPLKIPFKVDLRDLALWLSNGMPPRLGATSFTGPRTLETYLAALVSVSSGGYAFSVDDISKLSRVAPLLVVLDGLDEVADVAKREEVVTQVTRSISRLTETCSGLRVVITSRPAAIADSPHFDRATYPHISLGDVTTRQIFQYANQWMNVHKISLKERRDIESIMKQKMDQAHLRELCRNPMQLAIFLSLIHQRGVALPDRRTALYDTYVEHFLNRESEKTDFIRENRDLIRNIHCYLAWVLHLSAESGSEGRISTTDLRLKLIAYLEAKRVPIASDFIDSLFLNAIERVVMLVARTTDTFEFEVQPLREYFAARYLYESAPLSPAGQSRPGTKPEILDTIMRHSYWANVTRFFCGCYTEGELFDLAYRLVKLINDPRYRSTRSPASVSGRLLSDLVFSQVRDAEDTVTDALLPYEQLRNIANSFQQDDDVPRLSWQNGGEGLVRGALAIALRPELPLDWIRHFTNFARVNADTLTLTTLWLQSMPEMGESRLALRMARALGILATVRREDTIKLFDNKSASYDEIVDLYESGRLSELVYSASNLQSIERLAVDYATLAAGSIAVQSPLYLVPHFVALFVYDEIRLRYNTTLLQEAITRFQTLQPRLPETLKGFEKRAFEFSVQLVELVKANENVGTRQSSSLRDKMVDAFASYFGNSYSAANIANVACFGNGRRKARHVPLHLFDADVSLRDRVLTAKQQRLNVEWWKAQLAHVKDARMRMLLLQVIIAWMPIEIVIRLVEPLMAELDLLDDEQWQMLSHVIADPTRRFKGSRITYKVELVSSARFGFLLAHRNASLTSEMAQRFFSSVPTQREPIAVAQFRLYHALKSAIDRKLEWSGALEIVSRTYELSLTDYDHPGIVPAQFATRLPLEAAHAIASAGVRCPVNLWEQAERVIARDVRKREIHVGLVAKERGWFSARRAMTNVTEDL